MRLDQLLARARDGDAAALDALFRRFYPAVRDTVHRRIQSRLRAGGRRHQMLAMLSTGDIVQDVFEEVVRTIDHIDGAEEGAFVAFLTTLCEHRLVDQIRRYHASQRDVRRQVALDTGAAERARRRAAADPASAAGRLEELDIYRDVLATFSLRTQTLLALRLEREEPYADIAALLGYPSADAARKAFHEARALMLVRLRRRGVEAPAGQR